MRVLTPLCSAVLLAMMGANVQAMTLQEAIQTTIDFHPDLQSNIHNRLSSDQDRKVASSGYLPTVDLVGATGASAPTAPSRAHWAATTPRR